MAAEDEEIVYVVADVPVDAVLAPGTAYTISGLDTHAPKITIGEGDAAKTIAGALIETVSSTIVVDAGAGGDGAARVVAVSNNELKE